MGLRENFRKDVANYLQNLDYQYWDAGDVSDILLLRQNHGEGLFDDQFMLDNVEVGMRNQASRDFALVSGGNWRPVIFDTEPRIFAWGVDQGLFPQEALDRLRYSTDYSVDLPQFMERHLVRGLPGVIKDELLTREVDQERHLRIMANLMNYF